MFAYLFIVILYLAAVGLVAEANVVAGIIFAFIVPAAYIGLRLSRSRGLKLRIPIIATGEGVSTAFRTNAPEREIGAILQVAEEIGVKATATYKKGEYGGTAYDVVLAKDTIRGKGDAKKELSFASQSVVSILVSKGYSVIPLARRDVISGKSEGERSIVAREGYPMCIIYPPDNFDAAMAESLRSRGVKAFISDNQTNELAYLGICEKAGQKPAVFSFSQNFGVKLFADKSSYGFLADVAKVCYQMGPEATTFLSSVLAKAKESDTSLDPFALRNILQAELNSEKYSGALRDRVLVFAESLVTDGTWRGLVAEPRVDLSAILSRDILVDISSVSTESARMFVAYVVADWFERLGCVALVDGEMFADDVLHRMLIDVRVNQKLCILLASRRFAKSFVREAETIVMIKPDQAFYRSLYDYFPKEQVSEIRNKSPEGIRALKPSSLEEFALSVQGESASAEDYRKRLSETSPTLEVPELSKSYLAVVFDQQSLKAVVATMKYIQGYGTVELESAIQALDLGQKSQEVFSKLVRLGYVRKFVKAGISFCELTEKGEEELQSTQVLSKQGSA